MKQELTQAIIIGTCIVIGFSIFGKFTSQVKVSPEIEVEYQEEIEYRSMGADFKKITYYQNDREVTILAGKGDYSSYQGFYAIPTKFGYKVHLYKEGQPRNGETDILYIQGTLRLEK